MKISLSVHAPRLRVAAALTILSAAASCEAPGPGDRVVTERGAGKLQLAPSASWKSTPSFPEWKDSVRAQGTTDTYLVGDRVTPTGLVGEADARRFYDSRVAKIPVPEISGDPLSGEATVTRSSALILHNGQRNPGDAVTGSFFPVGSVLLYCIDRVGLANVVARHTYLPPGTDLFNIVDLAFGSAAAAWNKVVGYEMIHRAADRSDSCSPRPGDNITWYVRPAVQDPPIEYFSYVLHPKYILNAYNLPNLEQYRELRIWEDLIAEYAFPDPTPFGYWFSLEGLMARTIAQGLGFIDESNRGGLPGDEGTDIWPESCRDPSVGGVLLSVADPESIMLHPQSMTTATPNTPSTPPPLANTSCAGDRPWDYAISYLDAMGASCQYTIDPFDKLYYCEAKAQERLREQTGRCSPYPLNDSPASGSDCPNLSVNWNGSFIVDKYVIAVWHLLAS